MPHDPNDGTLASADNPVVMQGAYTVVGVLPNGVLAVYNGRNRHYDEETVAFIDMNRLTESELADVHKWQSDLDTLWRVDAPTHFDL